MQKETTYQLKSCVWELTLACCFSCKYCGSKGGKARENELTTEECLSVADQLVKMSCRRVSLIGGEVFMRSDWDIIARRLIESGTRVSIITNGFVFSDQIIFKLRDMGIESIAVSIDGTQEVHDRYRQEGSFRRAEEAVHILAENGILVSVISTLNHENTLYLEEFYRLLCEWPIRAWQLQACSPMGNAANCGVNYRFDPKIVIDFVQTHMFNAPFMMGIADNIGYYTDMEGYLRGNLSGYAFFSGCRAGLTSIGIDSIGNVRGCESLYDEKFNEGNLREKTLREIWENPEAFEYNRKYTSELLTGHCKTCEFGVYCGGGCRSYNYFVHKKLYEAPFCVRNENKHF